MTAGYWTYDPPNENVVLFRLRTDGPPARWQDGRWSADYGVLGIVMETTEITEITEITEQTTERVAELFLGALEAA